MIQAKKLPTWKQVKESIREGRVVLTKPKGRYLQDYHDADVGTKGTLDGYYYGPESEGAPATIMVKWDSSNDSVRCGYDEFEILEEEDVNEFEVGDKVYYKDQIPATVCNDGEHGMTTIRFGDGVRATVPTSTLRKRTLAEKRADDAKVIGESADKVQATLESGGRDYYGGDTVLKFIEDMGLGFSLGNSVKYIARAGKKDAATKRADLVKARDYLTREIDKLEETE